MTVKLNLRKAERRVLPETEEGYILNINVAQLGESKNGNPKLHIEFLVDEEAHPEFAGVRIYRDFSLLDQSLWTVKDLLNAALGEDNVAEQDEEGNFEFDEDDLVDCQVGAKIMVDDAYDGTPRNVVGQIFPVGEEA